MATPYNNGAPPPSSAEEQLEQLVELQDVISYRLADGSSLEHSLAQVGITSHIEETFVSNPVDKINIPEVRNATATFVYNYYTRDERLRPDSSNPSEQIVSLNNSTSDEIFYRLRNKKIARYVTIQFQPPSISNNIIGNVSLTNDGIDLSQDLKQIIQEGGLSNNVFVGMEILDTGKESKIYDMLNGAMFFMNIPTEENSPKEAAEKLYETLTEKGGLFGQDKKMIVNALSKISSEGYNLAPSDVPPEIAKFANDPIGKQTFSVQFNQLLMSELVSESTRIPDSLFQDELRSLVDWSKEARINTLNSIGDNVYQEIDYDLAVPAVKTRAANNQTNLNNFPDIKFAGYLLEKYEILPDEDVVFLGRRYIDNHQARYAMDEDVRYGGSYFYKIRTVCRVETILSSVNEDPTLNQKLIATVYMASEGVLADVNCVERVPPPTVTNIRATFDFKTLLPRLTWQFPLNKQRDIKRFQIFKRLSLDQPYVLLKEYDFDNSISRSSVSEVAPPKHVIRMPRPRLSFIDSTHKQGEKPIYTIACVDAHGMSSNLGLQVQVERDRYTNKVSRKVMSRPGAPKPYPNLFINVDGFQDVMKLSNYDRIKVFLDPEYYRVTKTETRNIPIPGTHFNLPFPTEVDQSFLAIDPNNFRYSMHIINTDNQKDALVKIKISKKASLAGGLSGADENFYNVSLASLSENNINFQYGIE